MEAINKTAIVIGVMAELVSQGSFAGMDEWQQQQLLDPPQPLLLAEAGGRINIYDGMPMDVVNRAMDEQFERIDHMMFTRIRHTTEQGEEVEDDGC